MSNIDKQAFRGQSVEGSFYLVECCNCGEMYPSNLLDGGEAIADSGDYGDCYCHLCGADDTERADWGDVNSNEAKAWNFQQKRIEALLDELEAKDNRINRLEAIVGVAEQRNAIMREWKRELKVPCDLVDNQVPVVIHGMVIRLERLKETEAKLESAESLIAELSASHGKLREAMAGIHNTIRGGGAYTSLAAILNASKRAYEESAAAAGKGE
ncbi:ead/Ea22-like family protein [Enterobacter sp. I4]|uniref:ead/Ea22-like family protein n=1 Tax=Enterobacter sp. I4 TaxID=2926672 RepID=UPI001F594F16|nr:ead/Ea22-like family protein [Enterobacter sp. I4]MCI2290958.1 ead/Ea22-like family protein [Enterobacter sp. I4]